jgi:hypothetical protein
MLMQDLLRHGVEGKLRTYPISNLPWALRFPLRPCDLEVPWWGAAPPRRAWHQRLAQATLLTWAVPR